MVDGQLVPEPDTMPTMEMMDKAYEGCGCETCKELNVNCDNCPVCQANEMKNDCCPDLNKQAPCWDGYVQRGMKPGKDGKPVPNCVPVAKTLFTELGKDYTKSKIKNTDVNLESEISSILKLSSSEIQIELKNRSKIASNNHSIQQWINKVQHILNN
jgi:hypothetical protein